MRFAGKKLLGEQSSSTDSVFANIAFPAPALLRWAAVVVVNTANQVQELLDRLAARGFDPADYWKIQRIVERPFPQERYWFFRQFGKRTIEQVLSDIDQAKVFLAEDRILSAEARAECEKSIAIAEMIVWQAIREVNSRVGPWTIHTGLVRIETFDGEEVLYDHTNLKIIAVHDETGEQRIAIIQQSELKIPPEANAWKRAYQELGIWELVYLGPVYKRVLSQRDPQGWPIFTKDIVPSLYEFLLPYYKVRGHYSQKRDRLKVGNAQFPKEMFEDMISILQIENPGFFDKTTSDQLAAVIQRYLAKKSKLPKLRKTQRLPT